MGLDPVTPPPVEVNRTGWADENSNYGWHSEDHPFYYNQQSRRAVLGPLGAYHDDTDWPAGMSWGSGSTHGRIDPRGRITWYEPSEIHEREREEAAAAMARELGSDNHQDITPSSFYDDDDWSDDHVASVHWSATEVSQIVHVPGRMYGFHSNDTPYIYNHNTGVLYHGDLGAFHSDVEQHPDINDPYDHLLRGRFTDDSIVHYSVPGYGSDEAHSLLPLHMAVEKALGVGGDPHFDYGQGVSNYDWTSKVSNILDPIHDTLDGRVWDNEGSPAPRMKPSMKKWLQKEIYTLAEHFHPDPAKWLRLIVTGSLTTYQYSDESDMDISLFVNPHFLPEWSRGQLIGLMVKHMDGTLVPGTPFPIQCFVVAKNISPADLYQHGLRSGYDLDQDHWLVPPDRSRTSDVAREHNIDYVYALESADKMERLLRYDPARAVDFWHQIHKRRMRDQTAGKGDFSQANIVYKMLAHRGLFPELSNASGEYIASKLPFWKQKSNPLGEYEVDPQAQAVPKHWERAPVNPETWAPGSFGKTMYHPSVGVIPPWKTESFGGSPFHSDMARYLGLPSMATSSAWITPEGQVYFPYEPVENSPPKHIQSVVDAVGPRITHEEAEFYKPDQNMYNNSLLWDDED